MSHDRLGLFDTVPDRRQIRVTIAIVALQFAALLIIMPLGNIPLGAINAFVPAVDAIMFTGKLVIGTLLYAQAAAYRSRALTVMASVYVLDALLLIPHALSFPGAFSTTGLLGAHIGTSVWLIIFARFAFPTGIILYVWLKQADSALQAGAERRPPPILAALAGANALAILLTLLATTGHDWLPSLFLNSSEPQQPNLAISACVTGALTAAAMIALLVQKKSVLDIWLLVALSGWLVESLLTLSLHGRFTLGWYFLFGIALLSSTIIMLALVAESTRLTARLALTMAARDREREIRLMSVDAVATALAHEAGQPLAGVGLNANAGLAWLSHSPPNTEMALKALQETVDAGTRTFDAIKSMRAIYGKRSDSLSDFCINDLVRETTALLQRELAAERIAVRLDLDNSLPPIRANRVQIQRVIVNLLTNAIDALAAAEKRNRRISILSAPGNGFDVLLDVCDSGGGIAPETMGHIFEPFFTTKPNGAGLGLSLSRTIVEDHGGSLWASTNYDQGAKFHLRLTGSPLSTPPPSPSPFDE